jgi:hypothetical protein
MSKDQRQSQKPKTKDQDQSQKPPGGPPGGFWLWPREARLGLLFLEEDKHNKEESR